MYGIRGEEKGERQREGEAEGEREVERNLNAIQSLKKWIRCKNL